IHLYGDQHRIQPYLKSFGSDLLLRVHLHHTDQAITMDDSVVVALRQKPQSSMRLAIQAVKHGTADACVSAGNTGALMALGRFILKTCVGIERPAIMSALPTAHGACFMLDLGANVGVSATHLYQFAQMGHAVVSAITGQQHPRIRLLNIGEEEIKGNDIIREAHALLKVSSLNYLGVIEGDGIFANQADIVVCDGLHGNIALKTAEGVAHLFADTLKAEFARTWWTKGMGLVALPVLKRMRKRLDPAQHNGGPLVGLTGTVIKSHGGADRVAFAHALEVAIRAAEHDVPAMIQAGLE
ncbi:MAG: phosphate acyltransferase PlsX, partial [Pseudomonadota bacterium]|nr:phosphate acyltransferase PlsX [Pseudomonadota bacterium]